MDLQWLITFCTIVDVGSFAKAADKLGYTQSTITFQIRQLEQELSVKLFDKIGRSMHLSNAGKQALPLAGQIVESINQLKELTGSEGDFSGDLTVSVVETVLANEMQEIIRKFLEKAPNVNLRIKSKTCAEIREALKTGEIDIGILYLVGKGEDPMLLEHPLTEIPMVLVGSGKTTANPAKVRHTLFFTEPRCAFHGMYKRYLDAHDLPLDYTISVGNMTTVLQGIEDGLGISYLPRFVVEEGLQRGSLKELPMENVAETAYVAYAIHKNKWVSQPMKLFVSLLQQHFPASHY